MLFIALSFFLLYAPPLFLWSMCMLFFYVVRWLILNETESKAPRRIILTTSPFVAESRVTVRPAAPMTRPRRGYGLCSFILVVLTIFLSQAEALQCYACNIVHEQRYVDVGCSNPEVITCSHSHKGFKHRFCIRTESVALGIMLTSGCATARHCHTEELPGVKIHCCGSDLCNSASRWRTTTLLPVCSLTFALTLLY